MAFASQNDIECAKTISEMISSLKSAFRSADFDRVEAILVRREEKLKVEIEAKAKENALVLQEKELAEERSECCRLDNITLESEVKELKKLNSQLSQKVNLLNERLRNCQKDKEVIIRLRKENCELKCANLRVENEVEALRSKYEDWDTRVSLLEKDFALLNGLELSCSKSWGVSEEGLIEKGVSENEKSSEKIENVKVEKEVLGEKEMGVENEKSKEKVQNVKTEVGSIDCHENVSLEAKTGSPAHSSSENGDGCVGGSGSGRPILQDVIEIGDSDDDDSASFKILTEKRTTAQGTVDKFNSGEAVGLTGTSGLKRKQATCVNVTGNDNNDDAEDLTGECKSTKSQKLIHGPDSSHVNHCLVTDMPSGSNAGGKGFTPSRMDPVILGECGEKMGSEHKSKNPTNKIVSTGFTSYDSDDSSSSFGSSSSVELDLSIDVSMYLPKNQQKRKHKWESEAEMVSALEKDGERCMRAVCALYKQQTFVEKSFSNSSTSQHCGFNKLDAIRGTTLAKFLIDGDPQGQPKKSVTELVAYDQNGLDDCKRLAIEHSKQLFEIYQQKEDLLFLN